MYILPMKKRIVPFLLLAVLAPALLWAGPSGESPLQTRPVPAVRVQASAAGKAQAAVPAPADAISRDMAKLERLYRFVDENFYKDVDPDKAYEAMATALFESLGDQYSYYVVASDKDQYIEDSFGTYGGIGLYFSKFYLDYQDESDPRTLYCLVDRVFPNTPCSRAGLRSDDLIIAIDGTPTEGLEATECAKMMKGEPGTKVQLTVRRGAQEFVLNLKREIVNVPTVDSTVIPGEGGGIGYIMITQFTSSTWSKVVEALKDYQRRGLDKLVIDLRSNPGGEINVALSIADCFIKEGELLSIYYKNCEPEVYYASPRTLVDDGMKVVVLTNGQTASSSEILTGALKDNGRATIIGGKTFGKGIMQLVSPFDEGYISLTEASFQTAGHAEIHEVGIEPDIQVEELRMTDEEAEAYTQVYNDGLIPAYVDAHPDFTNENIEAFSLPEGRGEIRHEILRVLVRSEYINRLPGDKQFLIDPDYDACLKTAIDFLDGKLERP